MTQPHRVLPGPHLIATVFPAVQSEAVDERVYARSSSLYLGDLPTVPILLPSFDTSACP